MSSLRRLVRIVFIVVVVVWRSAWALEPTLRDVAYGPYERNKLDLWQAPSATPTPLIVHIHGGGFYEGNKGGFWGSSEADLVHSLEVGVSVASISYRFLDDAPLQDILRDSARAIQFLRYNAASLNIDKTRVAAFGDSAGAGTSLWLAFHDDLAEPNNTDPVLRESTRLSAAGGLMPQATYDFAQWPAVLDIPQYVWYVSMWRVAPRYYRLRPIQANLDDGKKLRADLDMLSWIDSGDPPVYLLCNQQETKLTYPNLFRFVLQELTKRNLLPFVKTKYDASVNFDILHHPAHTRALERACDAKGLPCVAIYRDTPDAEKIGVYDFLLKHLRPL